MRYISILLVALPLVLLSCKKDKEEDLSAFEQTAKDQSLMESEIGAVFQIGHELLLLASYEDMSKTGPAYSGSVPSCANLDYNESTKVITVDFGTVPCLCKDGVYRQGRFLIRLGEENFNVKDAQVIIDFINYNVESVRYTGQILITNLAGNGAVQVKYNVSNAKAVTTTGTISWNSELTISKVAGGGTPSVFDDVYTFNGSSSGVNRRGVSYTASITTQLKKKIKLGCAKTFVSGVVTFNDSEKNLVILDYDPFDDEACDKIATLKINNRVSVEFNVR